MKTNSRINKHTGKTIWYIISTILLVLLYTFVIVELVFKFTGQPVYLFGNRYDVVKTDSMSVKNEDPRVQEFLKDRNDQIQPFDLVVSKKTDKNTKFELYDKVLFNHPKFGTDCHRVVNIQYFGDSITTQGVSSFDDNLFKFDSNSSFIETSTLPFSKVEMIVYSKKPYDHNFHINCYQKSQDYNVESIKEGDMYISTLTFNNSSTAPIQLHITRYYPESVDFIKELKIYSVNGDITLNGSMIKQAEEPNHIFSFNPQQRLLIRGDKADFDSDDGWYTTNEIYSKVVDVVPKAGYFFAYLSSIWGMIMIIGIALIITITTYLCDKENKKEKAKVTEPTPNKTDVDNNIKLENKTETSQAKQETFAIPKKDMDVQSSQIQNKKVQRKPIDFSKNLVVKCQKCGIPMIKTEDNLYECPKCHQKYRIKVKNKNEQK